MAGTNSLDFSRAADAELDGEMSRAEITETLELLFFSGNPSARKTVRLDAHVRRFLVDVLKAHTNHKRSATV